MIAGGGSPFQQRVLEQLDLRKSTARAALAGLVADATVEQRDEPLPFVDPLFAEWIGRLRRERRRRLKGPRRVTPPRTASAASTTPCGAGTIRVEMRARSCFVLESCARVSNSSARASWSPLMQL